MSPARRWRRRATSLGIGFLSNITLYWLTGTGAWASARVATGRRGCRSAAGGRLPPSEGSKSLHHVPRRVSPHPRAEWPAPNVTAGRGQRGHHVRPGKSRNCSSESSRPSGRSLTILARRHSPHPVTPGHAELRVRRSSVVDVGAILECALKTCSMPSTDRQRPAIAPSWRSGLMAGVMAQLEHSSDSSDSSRYWAGSAQQWSV